MTSSARVRFGAILVMVSAVFVAPVSAQANMLLGLESNGEFTNSDRVPALQNPALDKAKGLGAQVIRANINWAEIAAGCGGQSLTALADSTNACYRWDVIDNLVRGSQARGIQLLFSVSRSPYWVNGSSDNMFVGSTSGQFNRFVNNYVSFIRAIGARYNPYSSIGTVKMWTIWNEPNSDQFWRPILTRAAKASAPLRYAALYAKAAPALRAANSAALIAPGPTGPAPSKGIAPATYILAFQKYATKYLPGRTMALKRRYINAWAHNPYPYARRARDTSTSFVKLRYPNLPIQRVRDLIRTVDRSSLTRGRTIWATEFGYETPPDPYAPVSARLQGRYMAEAQDVLDATGRVSLAIWYGMTDPRTLTDWQSGSFMATGRIKAAAYWQRRPISVNLTSVRRGARVQVWSKSSVAPKQTRIQFSTNGRTWRTLTGVRRRADGSIRANIRMTRSIYFRTYDGVGGPAIAVAVRR